MLCRSVGLCVMLHAKAEQINVLFGVETLGVPRHIVLNYPNSPMAKGVGENSALCTVYYYNFSDSFTRWYHTRCSLCQFTFATCHY